MLINVGPQDEKYDHLEEADITKVDKTVSEAMIWMNSKINQQSKQSLTQKPVVTVKEVQAKMKVCSSTAVALLSRVHHLEDFLPRCSRFGKKLRGTNQELNLEMYFFIFPKCIK